MEKKPIALQVRLVKGRIKPANEKFSSLAEGINATTINPDATLLLMELERFEEIRLAAARNQPPPASE